MAVENIDFEANKKRRIGQYKLCENCTYILMQTTFSMNVMGRNICDKHGVSNYSHRLNENCKKCAIEKNVCQRCGDKIA